jgi:hypothetical protein
MKKILILTVLTAFIFAGCMSDNVVNNIPQNTADQKIEWIANSTTGLKPELELTISKTINGNVGGKILIGEKLGNLNISGSLTVPQGAYPGNQNVQITFNDIRFYQVYTPTPYAFRIPLVLNLIYNGLDLTNVDPSKVGFYYLSDNGIYYPAQYDSMIVDQASGTLGIVGAKIPHFSRWGWAKSTDE